MHQKNFSAILIKFCETMNSQWQKVPTIRTRKKKKFLKLEKKLNRRSEIIDFYAEQTRNTSHDINFSFHRLKKDQNSVEKKRLFKIANSK